MSDNIKLDELLIESSTPDQSKEDIQRYLDQKQAAYNALETDQRGACRPCSPATDVAEALIGMGRAE